MRNQQQKKSSDGARFPGWRVGICTMLANIGCQVVAHLKRLPLRGFPRIGRLTWGFLLIAWTGWAGCALGADVETPASESVLDEPATSTAKASELLALQQSELADRYARLENLLLRMADFDQAENPHRADLLKKAFALSRERHLGDQFQRLSTLLQHEEYGSAADNQQILKGDLDNLLKLLLSEDQSDRNKNDQNRVRDYIRELERLARLQRSLRGRTESRLEPELPKEQKDLADRTGNLDRQIKDNESLGSPDSDAKSTENSPQSSTKDPTEKKPSEEEAQPGKSESKETEPGEPKPGESSPAESAPGESKPSPAQPSPSQPSQSQPSQSPQGPEQPGESKPSEGESGETPPASAPPEDFPGRKQIRIAQDAMKEAQGALEKAQQSGAVEAQRKAEEALAAAKAELEQILRQLREEEIERVLTMLETRFRRMLEMQVDVHANTERLQESRSQGDDRVIDIEAGKLGFTQRRIVVEADKALVLLRAEGTSVAFPETVEQMRMDMEQVADRLSRGLVESITQGLEEDIISTLEELLEALKQSQKEQEERKQDPAPPQSGEEDNQGLLDKIAELKMIKSLQIRINKRTARYSQLLQDANDQVGQAADPELRTALQKLAEREAEVQRITRETVLGKNQ